VAIASENAPLAAMPPSVAWVRARCAQGARNYGGKLFRQPAKALQLVAVTGTNGKTTTTSLIDAIIKASGAKTGLFGTIAYHTPLKDYPAPNTTPESVDLQAFSQRFATRVDALPYWKQVRIHWLWIACGVPLCGGGFHELDARAHGLSQDV